MIDLLYLASNRLEFTKASTAALIKNTDWSQVERAVVYDDESYDGTNEFLSATQWPVETSFRPGVYGSPVEIMNDYLRNVHPEDNRTFAKIDNDTMVPAGWLGDCLKLMRENPHIDLLGIEPMHEVSVRCVDRTVEESSHIGGIGLMRSGAFRTLPRPNGRFGFTAWQEQSQWVSPAWINPALPVFLLDKLPRSPWRELTETYIHNGWSRGWPAYGEDRRELWSWWCE